MIEKETRKNKHLTLEERIEIQECLDRKMSFKSIGKLIGKDQTTISKEVKKHLEARDDGVSCFGKDGSLLTREVCPELFKAPFVCNPCAKRHSRCKYTKQFYHAKAAQKAYESLLCEAREGIPLNKESFYEIDRLITEGVRNGQHLYHIMKTHELGISKSTVYRHVKAGYLSVGSMDFPRIVKFKPRKPKPAQYVPRAVKLGRTYEDFLAYITENAMASWVEMDTVIGRPGGKVIVTFDFTVCNFMFGLLSDSKTAADVSEKIIDLKARLSADDFRFGDILPVVLTDNGGEFSDVASVELDNGGQRETRLFFCNPYKSCQKPRVEKNHTLFRDIVPKGSSFDDFSQETVDLIFSHVNSVKRKSLNGKTPFEMFVFLFGKLVAKILGIESIPAQQVIQSPLLLKKRQN
jgi:IS30 family transposase